LISFVVSVFLDTANPTFVECTACWQGEVRVVADLVNYLRWAKPMMM